MTAVIFYQTEIVAQTCNLVYLFYYKSTETGIVIIMSRQRKKSDLTSSGDNYDLYYVITHEFSTWILQTLTDKNKTYKNRLEREETSKKQQLKIMRRTHEAHQQEKQTLITTLEEIVEEQEHKVAQLESQLRGGCSNNLHLVCKVTEA